MLSQKWLLAWVALLAAPLAYYQHQRHIAQKKRCYTIKLLRKVHQIALEVELRLMHLEAQVKELVESEANEKIMKTEVVDPAVNSSLNSYYHFDSHGNKLKTKWDSYDVDAELDRFEKVERGEPVSTVGSTKPDHKTPQITKSKAFAISQGIEQEFEAILSFLDDIRGDDEVKQLRKAIVEKVTTDFTRIDALQAILT